MNEIGKDFSCELPQLIRRLQLLEDLCWSYREEDEGNHIDFTEDLIHGIGDHIQSISSKLDDINKALYGS